LLEGYLSRRDEAAFEALVRRHGPMVLGVCRRILGNSHDAEDAFQATFLVLVRKAAAIRPRSMVGNWLYGVARRTSLEARRVAAKRRAKEAAVLPRAHPPDDDRTDLRAVLDEELQRLPAKCRAVIILSDLEGKTRKEVARQLGWPEGTVASRLARARARLAKRLAHYGLAVSAGLVGTLLPEGAAPAFVPTSLVVSTVKAASLLAAGQAAAGTIPAQVAALMEGALKAMLLNKVLKTTTLLLVVVAFGTVSWYGYTAGFSTTARSGRVPETKQQGAEEDERAVAPGGVLQGKGAPKEPAEPLDPLRVNRMIGKQPSYQTTPRYCLLLFGPEGKSRVWLVLDGDTLYIDRNGNGDLTERGEAVQSADPRDGEVISFKVDALLDDGRTKHTNLYVHAITPDKERKAPRYWDVRVDVADRYRQAARVLKLGDRPQDAPLVHFGGPLKMHMAENQTLVRGDKGSELTSVSIDTKYPGVEWVSVEHGRGVPKDVHPIAEITFPANTPDAKPVTLKVPLTQRRSGSLFDGSVRVPEQAGSGTAKVVLSFADWKEAKVESATYEVPIIDQGK
jgi:RNA polymerase sigma factor (sigma-70 family)